MEIIYQTQFIFLGDLFKLAYISLLEWKIFMVGSFSLQWTLETRYILGKKLKCLEQNKLINII